MLRQYFKASFPHLWYTLKRLRQRFLNLRSSERVFARIYRENSWGDGESRSGPGSSLQQTAIVREFLPEFLAQVDAKTFLDLPCGDLFWIERVDLKNVQYIGGDIVPEIVNRNRTIFAGTGRQFEVLDIVTSKLPKVDVLLCRDCFIHLPFKMILAALDNVRKSGIVYLITTTYPDISENIDIELGGFREINLQLPPFNLEKPSTIRTEYQSDGKSLGVWKL